MQRNDENSETQSSSGTLRDIKRVPFCWQEKKILNVVTETFAESNQAGSARSLYLALTELASDAQNAIFKASKALIAHKSGLSIKTVERLLHGLEALRIVRIDRELAETGRGSIRAANTYSLLSMRRSDATSMRHHGRQRSKSDKVEESGKIFEEGKKNVAVERARDSDREAQLEAIAAAAAGKVREGILSDDGLAEFKSKLRPLFPKLDINDEWERCGEWCAKHGKPQDAAFFTSRWLPKARPTLRPNNHRKQRGPSKPEDFHHPDA